MGLHDVTGVTVRNLERLGLVELVAAAGEQAGTLAVTLTATGRRVAELGGMTP